MGQNAVMAPEGHVILPLVSLRSLRRRLSLLMFLQYAPAGAVIPLFTVRLRELQFTPWEIGLVSAAQALANLVAPLAAGQVADRWLPAERCLAACAGLGGILLWLLAGLTTPGLVFVAYLAFWLVMGPAISLGTALSFAHLEAPERDFGPVRMWGTVGWVVPGWMLGYWFSDPDWLCRLVGWLRPQMPQSEIADLFHLAALLAFLQGAYALTLPHTPPKRQPGARLATLAALRLLHDRAFAVYSLGAVGVCMTIALTTQTTPLLLEQLGIPRPWLAPTLTISQSMEITSLALLPMLLLRLGLRGTMLLGLGSWTLALTILTAGQPLWLIVASQGLNGLCICCYLVAGQVFVNSRARGDIRSSAQGLVTFLNGLGMLLGSVLAGGVCQLAGGAFPPTFGVGALLALLLMVAFFLGFPGDDVIYTSEK